MATSRKRKKSGGTKKTTVLNSPESPTKSILRICETVLEGEAQTEKAFEILLEKVRKHHDVRIRHYQQLIPVSSIRDVMAKLKSFKNRVAYVEAMEKRLKEI